MQIQLSAQEEGRGTPSIGGRTREAQESNRSTHDCFQLNNRSMKTTPLCIYKKHNLAPHTHNQ